MKVNKKQFEVEVGGEKVKLEARRPDTRQKQQANLVYARAFRNMVKPADGGPGFIVRSALEGVMREQKLWDDEKQARADELAKLLADGELRLRKGGIRLSEARELAISMRRWRAELNILLAKRNELDLNTAEAQAEQARFNYLVSACTVRADTGKPYFSSQEDYEARADDDQAAASAAGQFGQLYYGVDEDFYGKLPENEFLLRFRFCRPKDFHLVDKDGRLINADGKLVNEDGFLVDDKGNPVDDKGNPVDKDGRPVVQAQPFLDDDGRPVAEAKREPEAKPEAAQG
jgi:hypothetical protein